MKLIKLSFILPLFLPILYLGLENYKPSNNHKEYNVVHFAPVELDDLLLIHDFVDVEMVNNEPSLILLLSYQEALLAQNDQRRLPSKEELTKVLQNAGFNSSGLPGLIPDEYYALGLQYPGIQCSIMGNMSEGEKVGFWFEETPEGENYLMIKKNELYFTTGRITPESKMSVRFISPAE